MARVQPKPMGQEEFNDSQGGTPSSPFNAVNPDVGTKDNRASFKSATGVDHDDDDLS